MATKQTKAKPTREQLAGLAALLNNAPAVSNDAQAKMWADNGAAQGWAAMKQSEKEAFRVRFQQAQ